MPSKRRYLHAPEQGHSCYCALLLLPRLSTEYDIELIGDYCDELLPRSPAHSRWTAPVCLKQPSNLCGWPL